MEYLEIAQLLQAAPVRLLQSPNAAMILGFLHRAFKASFRPAIPEGELRFMFENYLGDLEEVAPGRYVDTAANYLAAWRDPQHGFVRRSYEETHDEPIFELTSGAEKALLWIESLRRAEFVGTESRLASIFAGLDEIVRFASGDVDERIALLNADARRIQDEIDRIRSTGKVEQYSSVKLASVLPA